MTFTAGTVTLNIINVGLLVAVFFSVTKKVFNDANTSEAIHPLKFIFR